jgi:hypothetical protein
VISLASIHYLVPPSTYFWHWDSADHAAVWSDGTTLAFAREVLPLLRELAHDAGLPPLGSLLLVIAAAKHPSQITEKWELLDRYARSLGVNDQAPGTVERLQRQVLDGLRLIAQLPTDLLQTQAARLNLLQTLFSEGANRLAVAKSIEIVDEFRAASAAESGPGVLTRQALL